MFRRNDEKTQSQANLEQADSAEQELLKDLKEFGLDPEDVSMTLVKAYSQKRLTVNVERESFTYQLTKPIKLEDGTHVSIIEITEPDGGALEYAGRFKSNEVALANALIAKSSGLALGLVSRIKQRDYLVLGEILGLFQ